jgi:hypothetical protein
MRFEFFHEGLRDTPKLSVDGTVGNAIHFSHWQANQTPAEVKADTSTGIALNLVASPERDRLTNGIDLIVNNHFDTDGVLSVWTVLTGDGALRWREKLIAAAEAGDFSEFSNEEAVKISLTIQGSDSPEPGEPPGSPLANQLAGGSVESDARAYELVLPKIPELLTDIDRFESLWRGPWERIDRALKSFAQGSSAVEEDNDHAVSLVLLAPEVFSSNGFKPTRHAAPFTAISHNAKGRFFVIATPVEEGWVYRLDYPYYSWAETVVRPRIFRRDLTSLIARLNQLEQAEQRRWAEDDAEMTSAAKCFAPDGTVAASVLKPEAVAAIARDFFSAPVHQAAGN